MENLGTNRGAASSVPDREEASGMNHYENEQNLDAALADLYAETPSLQFERNWRVAVRREEQTQMKQKKNIWLKTVLPIAAALVLVLGAGWVGTLEDESIGDLYRKEARSAKTGSSNGGINYSMSSAAPAAGGTALMSNYSADMAMEEAVYESEVYDTAAAKTADTGDMETAQTDDRKLIRTVSISLRTENYDADIAGIQNLLTQFGGYTENMFQSGEAGSAYGRNANFTFRVPSARLDEFVTGLTGYGRVTSRSESTEDKTVEYYDNETRLQTLRTKMERLNTLLSQAEQVSDILEIESEIADTQYQLDRYESKQLNINRRVDMSYVYVDVNETVAQDDADDEELTLVQRLGAALKASLEGMGRFGRNLLVFLTMALPVILPVAVVVLVIVLVRRKNRKNRQGAMQPENDGEEE